MPQLAIQSLYVLSGVVLLGILGLSLLGDRSHSRPLALFASPQAGLLVLTVVTLLVYSVLHVRLGIALLTAIPICVALTVGSLLITGYSLSFKDTAFFLLFAALGSTFFVWANCSASVVTNAPSVLYADGTDHLGYAQMADWMRDHAPSDKMAYAAVPRGNPSLPYESFPNIMLGSEPRMGAFAFLGIVGLFEHVPSSFAYDSACAIAIFSSVLGVAAIFATRYPAFLVLALGLSVAHWYDFQRAGYFGKALAYPVILFTVGLFLQRRGDTRPWTIAPLMVASIGSGLMLSGYLTALILLLLGLTVIFFDAIYSRRVDTQEVGVLALMAASAVTASGFLVRPYGGGFPKAPFDAFQVALRALEIAGWITTAAVANRRDWVLLVLAATATIGAAFLAHRLRNGGAVAFLLAPAAFLGGLLICGARDTAFQLTGFYYPATLCGLVMLASSLRTARTQAFTMAAFVFAISATIGTRLPRAIAALGRYTDTAFVAQHSLSLDEFDAIERAVKGQTVLVALGPRPQLSIAALVELGRRGVPLQWTAEPWYFVVGGWRGWSLPRYESQASLSLIPAGGVAAKRPLLVTRNFAIVNNGPNEP